MSQDITEIPEIDEDEELDEDIIEPHEYEEETESVVVWEFSEFSSETKQFPVTIEVTEDENGKKILDPSEITWRTPATSFGVGFPRPTEKAYPNDKPISISISETDIINPLVAENSTIQINAKTQEGIFAQVVKAVSDIWNTKLANGNNIGVRQMAKQTGMNQKTWQNYLHVADYAGLFMKVNRGRRRREDKPPVGLKKKFIDDFEEWKIEGAPAGRPMESPVNVWITKIPSATKPLNQTDLQRAMKIMQVTPSFLMQLARKQPSHEAKTELEDLLVKDRMPDPRNAKNIFPKKKMVKKNGELVLPNNVLTPKSKNPRCWSYGFWDQTHQGKNTAGVPIYNPKLDPNKYKLPFRWSLEDLSNHMDAPDPFGGEKKKGEYKGIWFGKARQISLGSIKRKENNVFYNYVGLIRQFMDVHGMGIGKMPEESPLSQVANPPRKAHISLSVDQIEKLNAVLKEGMEGKILTFNDWDTYHIKAEEIKFKTVEEAKSYWHDAYFYFKLSLDLGFRAEEAFTLVATELDFQTVGGAISGESGVFISPNGDMTVNIYTRKSDKGKKGQKIHGGFIIAEETKNMIKNRLDEVKAGMQDSVTDKVALEKYGVVKTYDDAPYLQHSLIGDDGRYTMLGTLDRPATAYGEERKLGIVKPTGRRNNLKAILRHCYHDAELKDEYWYKHTLHSLRHVFAQYWLELSDYNYGFVAGIGHWKTVSIVKEIYGKKAGADVLHDMRSYAGIDPMVTLRKREEERKSAPTQATKLGQMFYGDDEKSLEKEDYRLREIIFYDGGEYYDVRLPEDQRNPIFYPAGTDIQFKNKGKDNPLKKLFKIESKVDGTTQKSLSEGN